MVDIIIFCVYSIISAREKVCKSGHRGRSKAAVYMPDLMQNIFALQEAVLRLLLLEKEMSSGGRWQAPHRYKHADGVVCLGGNR